MELENLLQNPEALALHGLDNLADFAPMPYEPAPGALASAIQQVRAAARQALRVDLARERYEAMTSDPAIRLQLGEYREHVTYVEKVNARRLATGCWVLHVLTPRALDGDVELTRKLERLRVFLQDEYGVTELKTERGWAEAQTERRDLLPSIWRHA